MTRPARLLPIVPRLLLTALALAIPIGDGLARAGGSPATPEGAPQAKPQAPPSGGAGPEVEVLARSLEFEEIRLRDREPKFRTRERLFSEPRVYPFKEFPAEAFERALAYMETMPRAYGPEAAGATAPPQSVAGERWVNIGPAPIRTKRFRASGRVLDIAVPYAGGNLLYAGSALGGVWKSINGGGTWDPRTDHQPALGITSLVVDPQNKAIIYAATGEAIGGGERYSAGVLRSLDSGVSWSVVGRKDIGATWLKNKINKLAIDPRTVPDPRTGRTLLAATVRGLYRSLDSGQSWSRIRAGNFTDVVIDAVDPDIAFAVQIDSGHRGLTKYEFSGGSTPPVITPLYDPAGILPAARYNVSRLAVANDGGTPVLFVSMRDTSYGSDLKGIFSSRTRGQTWDRLTGHPREFADGLWAIADRNEVEPNGTPTTADGTIPSDTFEGTISSPSDEDWVWFHLAGQDAMNIEVLADRAGSNLNAELCLYDSAGAPVRFRNGKGQQVHYCKRGGLKRPNGTDSTDSRMLTGWKEIPSGNYYVRVKSADGTTGRYQLSVLGIDLNCQCDYDQVLAVDPNNPAVMYAGLVSLFRSTDGGQNWTEILDQGTFGVVHADIHSVTFDPEDSNTIYVGTDGGVFKSINRGNSWVDLNSTLAITQSNLGISQHETNPDFMLIGNQDNGSVKLDNGIWEEVYGGDGSATAIADIDEWYVSAQGLWVQKYSTSPSPGVRPAVNGLGTAGAAFYAPIVRHPTQTRTLLAGGGNANPADKNKPFRQVFRTTDGGAHWKVNSINLGFAIVSIAFAPSDPTTYYAVTGGRRNRTIWRGSNDGQNWSDLTWLSAPDRAATDVSVSPVDDQMVYLTFSGFGTGHVYRQAKPGDAPNETQDGWTDISSAPYSATPLPDIPANVITIDPNYPDTLFVGTDIGVFRSTDDGRNWARFDLGLPRVPVTDILIGPNTGPDGKMRVATYGRSVWELRPDGDSCEAATVITDGSYRGTTHGAKSDGGSSCDTSSGSPDVWYEYTATCDGTLRVGTCDADFPAVVSVHNSSCPGSETTELVCSSSCSTAGCTAGAACTALSVNVGSTYMIRVAGRGGQSGNFTLDVQCEIPNDECATATDLTGVWLDNSSTAGANPDWAPTCAGVPDEGAGVWYSVVGTGNTMTASTCNSTTTLDTRLSVYCAGCASPSCITADDNGCGDQLAIARWCAAPGKVYRILVHGAAGEEGPFKLEVGDDGLDCGPFYLYCAPGNDHCAGATDLSTSSRTGDNTDADTEVVASCRESNSDIWYRYHANCVGHTKFDTCGGGTLTDTVLTLYDGCQGEELDCNDDFSSCGLYSQVSSLHRPDTDFSLRVAGYGAGPLQGTVQIQREETVAALEAPWPGLYTGDGQGSVSDRLFHIDPEDGSWSEVGPLGIGGLSGMAYAEGIGIMYGVDDSSGLDQMVEIDLGTGTATVFADITGSSLRGLAFDRDTLRLYGVDSTPGNSRLKKIHPVTGAVSDIGPTGFAAVEALAYDADGDTLYGADTSTGQLITIDPTTGAGTVVGYFGAGNSQIEGLAWDSVKGVLYGVRNDAPGDGYLMLIDHTSGAATEIAGRFTDMAPHALGFAPGLPSGNVGQPYSASIPHSGGCPRYLFSYLAGLPPELTLDDQGRITGTPMAAGSYVVDFTLDDSDISTPAINASMPLIIRPDNDECAEAIPVATGVTEFETNHASTDGPAEPETCLSSGDDQVGSDVWFCHEATCSGTLNVSLCGSAYDTRVALYDGCGCPRGPSARQCNDDSCGTQSEVSRTVNPGDQVLIRVGGYNAAQGAGAMTITCEGTPAGACCFSNSCSIDTNEGCTAAGGSYIGDGSDCSNDTDGDGAIDDCDSCPVDPAKTEPGVCGCGQPDADSDGDGEMDCVDEDIDGDGVSNSLDIAPGDPSRCLDVDRDGCDDCASLYNDPARDGSDQDGDGACDVGDCDSGDPSIYPTAPEINDGIDNQCPGNPGAGLVDEITGDAGFHDPLDKSVYSWPPQDGCTAYEVARSTEPRFQLCVRWSVSSPSLSDVELPGAGGAYHYLVRATAPNAGSWGADSAGVERTPCP